MQENNMLIPNRRFSEFASIDKWQIKRLGEISTIIRGASPRPIADPKWFDDSSDTGWLRISDVTEQDGRIYNLEQRISKIAEDKTRILKEEHLLMSIAATVGKPVINYVKTGVHDGFLIFKNIDFDIEFMFQFLEFYRNEWKKFGQPGSQVNLNSQIVKNSFVNIPKNEKEQIKIGEFFKAIDNIINLHQQKIDKLKELKAAYLNDMFPKEGDSVPRLRFAGFKYEWDSIELENVARIDKGDQLNRDDMIKDGKYYVLNGGINPSGRTNKYNVPKNTISVSEGGNSCGYVNFNEENFWSGGHNYTLSNLKINIFFLYYYLKSKQDEIMAMRIGSGLPNIQKSAMLAFEVSVTKKSEQIKIGEFFRNLDNQIKMQEDKLEKLKQMKQAYLNEMFV